MNEPITSFKQLRVYRSAFEMAMQIFDYSKQWPKEEQYALTDQVRRASRSVCSNIAEAWFKRRYPNHFVSKLSDADTEASETLVWIDFAVECQYMPNAEAEVFREKYRAIIGGLTKIMAHPEQWCVPDDRVSETPAGYLDSDA
jgi:four helix bundle protein